MYSTDMAAINFYHVYFNLFIQLLSMVRPLLKKSSLPLIFNSFRPVSNLSYLSKLIEHVVCEKIMSFAERSGNLEKYQSAYQPDHSMETALLKVRTDLLAAIDHKEVTCLILLDLSVAFDMVDHQLLLNHLRFRFGMERKSVEWIESYLTGRNQQAVIGSHQSSPKELGQGVPQGSVLGPILFTLYMSPLGDICRQHGIYFHGYANDSQNYLSFRPSRSDNTPTQECLLKLQNCIGEIRNGWERTYLSSMMMRLSSSWLVHSANYQWLVTWASP